MSGEQQFRGQKSGEALLAVFHKNLLAYFKSLLVIIVLVVVAFLIGLFLPALLSLSSALILALIIAGLIALRVWFLWANNLFLVTNLRVIIVSQNGFFAKEIKEAYLEDVCNVSAQVNGFLQSVFDFGDVLVQTETEITLKDVQQPYDVKESIYNAVHSHKGGKALEPETKFWKVESEA